MMPRLPSWPRPHWRRRVSPASSPALLPASIWPRLESVAELARLPSPVRGALAQRLDLLESAHRFCPVQLQDDTALILAHPASIDSDAVAELEALLVRQGLQLARPARWAVPAAVLLAVVRDQLALPVASAAPAERASRGMHEALQDMLAWGLRHDASDLHINLRTREATSEVRFTVGGRYVAPARYADMPTRTLQDILAVAWMDVEGGNGAVFDPHQEQQGRLYCEVQGQRLMLRWASLAADRGVSVCLRLLRLDARIETTLQALGYLPSQCQTLQRVGTSAGGAVVLSGVVGSGKSTTIATLLAGLPAERKLITLEDPVEYLIPGALQNTVRRHLAEAETDVFGAKLRTVKRSAMQDLLIGEVRDRQTGQAFIDLVGSGVSLYTTVHAGAAMLVPERLSSQTIGVPRDLLATPGVLRLLVYQSLVPRLCPHCARPALQAGDTARRQAELIARLYAVSPAGLRVRHPAGCSECRQPGLPALQGLQGRTVVAEMIEPGLDEGFLRRVREGDLIGLHRHLALRRRAAFDDPDMTGKTALECAVYKALQGEVDPSEIESRFRTFETVALEQGT